MTPPLRAVRPEATSAYTTPILGRAPFRRLLQCLARLNRYRVSNDDSQAKAQMGHLWQKASQGQGLYLMATKSHEGLSVGEQLVRVVRSSRQ